MEAAAKLESPAALERSFDCSTTLSQLDGTCLNDVQVKSLHSELNTVEINTYISNINRRNENIVTVKLLFHEFILKRLKIIKRMEVL